MQSGSRSRAIHPANLALATCIALRDGGLRVIRGAALLYGAYSLELDTASARANGGGAYFLSTAEMTRYWNDYVPRPADRQSPLAVPMLANLANLPPLCIVACEFDPLLDDSRILADRAKAAGVDFEFHLWKSMVHGAASVMGWIDALAPEVDRIGEFLRNVTRAA